MRFRLVIPAAIAAVATYLALVRDEAAIHVHEHQAERPTPAATSTPAGTTSAPDPPRAPEPVTAPHPPGPPSQYIDLAPPVQWDSSLPSVYDLLAGEPPSESMTQPAPESADTAMPPEAPPDDLWSLPALPDTPLTPAVEAAVDLVGDVPPRPGPSEWPPSLAESSSDPLPPQMSDAPVMPTTQTHTEPPQTTTDSAVLDEGRFALGGWAASAGHSMVSAVTFRQRLTNAVTADQIVLDIDVADNIPDDGLIVLADPGFAPDNEGFTLLLAAAYPGPFSAAGSYRVMRRH